MRLTRLSAAIWLLCASVSPATAQPPVRFPGGGQNAPAGRIWRLGALHESANRTDPRLRALQLHSSHAELRMRNIETERRPSIAAEGQVQYQSDVPTPPAIVPGGQPLFSPRKDVYDAYLRIDQRLVDPTIAPRLAAERAQLAEAQARVRTALFALRQEVNEAFFAAALLQERIGTLAATIAVLDARLREVSARAREGAALASDAAAVEATLLQRRQDEGELRANRRAALARLARLTGDAIADTDVLDLPQLTAAVAQARGTADGARARPEYEQFARTRERMAREQDVVTAREQPRLSAFARVGYGRPGLNFISDQFEPYGLAGVHIQWNALTWGAPDREREALALQQQIVSADEAAFARVVDRSTQTDLAAIDRLENALALDDRIIALREQIDRSTQLRLQEGVVTAAEYLARSTELLDARFARAGHRVELAQAGAKFLTTLGLEVR